MQEWESPDSFQNWPNPRRALPPVRKSWICQRALLPVLNKLVWSRPKQTHQQQSFPKNNSFFEPRCPLSWRSSSNSSSSCYLSRVLSVSCIFSISVSAAIRSSYFKSQVTTCSSNDNEHCSHLYNHPSYRQDFWCLRADILSLNNAFRD